MNGHSASLRSEMKIEGDITKVIEDKWERSDREDTLTAPPIQGASLEAPALKPLDVNYKKMKKVSPSHASSPKVADNPTNPEKSNPEKFTRQQSKPLSPVEAKGESPAGDRKSPYLTTKPHHTYSPRRFHVPKIVPGRRC